MIKVKVSAKMARLPFNGCDPEYIKTTCKASCCQSSQSKTGTMISVLPEEVAGLTALGVGIIGNMLQPAPGEKKCPFKCVNQLCSLHNTEHKPFGCIASPFTLNASNTLIIRHRYIMLKCYNDGAKMPAYKAFRASLDLIFGMAEAERICALLDAGSGDVAAYITEEVYNKLVTNDKSKKNLKNGL